MRQERPGGRGRGALLARFCHDERGVAATEFAFVIIILFAMISGLIGYGMAMFDRLDLVASARAGAQIALYDDTDTTAIRNAVVNASTLGIDPAKVFITPFCECADGTTIVCGGVCVDGSDNRFFIRVRAEFDHTMFVLGDTVPLHGEAVVRTR